MTRTLSASRSLARSFAFVAVLPLVACGGGGALEVPPPPPPMSASVAASAPVAIANPGAPRSPVAAGASPNDPARASTAQKIVRDASIGVEVSNEKKIAPVLARAHETASYFGGYVAEETSTTISFKVPTEKLDAALDRALKGDGHVVRRDITARDVTSSYVDLSIRIENARRMKDRLKELAGKTEDVARLLEIEKELSRVTTELEELEGQMRLMDNQTTYATATIDVTTEVSPGPVGYVFYGLYKGVKWLFVWT